ncbi:GTPase-GDP dissociation stimulator vimar isoform X2 [Prorops nasuta]|uniref:GTPase-GDP dissociation stimulator vimar isoform X2 n=1 Tax=Prorops nasuta TaxID=863751 RepID=UPI0034CD9D63
MEGGTQESINKIVHELKNIATIHCDFQQNNSCNIENILQSLNTTTEVSIKEALADIIDNIFIKLLRHKISDIQSKAAKAVADISKIEEGRRQCTNETLIKELMSHMQNDNTQVLVQTCRALGNICYKNENAKSLIHNEGGLKTILNVLKIGIVTGNLENGSSLRNVASGLLLNFLSCQDILKKEDLDDEILPLILKVLEIEGPTGGEAAMSAIIILELLKDVGVEFEDEKLTKILVSILASNVSSELSEACLEFLYSNVEKDKIKIFYAKTGLVELLIELLEKHSFRCNDETRSVLQVACNLIILILTEDYSMNLLYDESNGIVYKKLSKWLDSSDEDLQLTAVLAMGNFARTDSHCRYMVSVGIHCKLLKLLNKNNNVNGNIRFQTALLSVLRNLVIAAENKYIILNNGLIDALYPMLDIPSLSIHIVFKLLGTLRIVLDGQEMTATTLGKRDNFIKWIVNCCKNDHVGVQSEARRLLARLIISSKNQHVASLMVKNNSIFHLVSMLTAQHALMQNEAILSLTFLATFCLNHAESFLIKADIRQVLINVFDQNVNSLDVHLIQNALTFLESIIKSGNFYFKMIIVTLKYIFNNTLLFTEKVKTYLKDSKLNEVLTTNLKTQDNAEIKDKTKEIIIKLKHLG